MANPRWEEQVNCNRKNHWFSRAKFEGNTCQPQPVMLVVSRANPKDLLSSNSCVVTASVVKPVKLSAALCDAFLSRKLRHLLLFSKCHLLEKLPGNCRKTSRLQTINHHQATDINCEFIHHRPPMPREPSALGPRKSSRPERRIEPPSLSEWQQCCLAHPS